MARTGIAALCLLLVAFVDLGSSMRCYLCTSANDSQCGDPFSSRNSLQECGNFQVVSEFNRNYLTDLSDADLFGVTTLTPNSPRYCHKIVRQDGVVIRNCLDVNPNSPNATCNTLAENGRIYPPNHWMRLKHCSVCETDGCNGASTQIASISLALVALMSAYFNYRQ